MKNNLKLSISAGSQFFTDMSPNCIFAGARIRPAPLEIVLVFYLWNALCPSLNKVGRFLSVRPSPTVVYTQSVGHSTNVIYISMATETGDGFNSLNIYNQ